MKKDLWALAKITLIILEVQKRNTMFLFSMTLLVYSGNTVLLQV